MIASFSIVRRNVAVMVLCLLVFTSVSLSGCSRAVERRQPLGEVFPTVEGRQLSGKKVELPSLFLGQPTIVLVGYVQDSQFDIDRWILGLNQLDNPLPIVEVPTIAGFFPQLFSGSIDEGMRSGIPEEDWPLVVTVYDGAEKIITFLGNANSRNARVLLLDEKARVRWMADRGYSAALVSALDQESRRICEEIARSQSPSQVTKSP